MKKSLILGSATAVSLLALSGCNIEKSNEGADEQSVTYPAGLNYNCNYQSLRVCLTPADKKTPWGAKGGGGGTGCWEPGKNHCEASGRDWNKGHTCDIGRLKYCYLVVKGGAGCMDWKGVLPSQKGTASEQRAVCTATNILGQAGNAINTGASGAGHAVVDAGNAAGQYVTTKASELKQGVEQRLNELGHNITSAAYDSLAFGVFVYQSGVLKIQDTAGGVWGSQKCDRAGLQNCLTQNNVAAFVKSQDWAKAAGTYAYCAKIKHCNNANSSYKLTCDLRAMWNECLADGGGGSCANTTFCK